MSFKGDLLKGGIDYESGTVTGYKIIAISSNINIGDDSATEATLFVAPYPVQVTAIYYTTNVIAGAACTGTVVKATGTAAPVKTTTPMHTADAIDFETAVHTVQTMTLSSTTADLKLVAGERIGYDTAGTKTNVEGTFTIIMKAI